jgi:uroporphyrinogen-III synthase
VSHEPLAGFTVGVTAARRREELSSLLERRGARVVYAPAIRLVPLADDTELLDDVIVTTGVGFRAWLETAEGWGLREDLIKLLGEARVLAHGPRAMGAVRAAGVRETWSPSSDGREDLLRHLLEQDLTGRRIAVQVDGEPASPLTGSLRRAGAHVIEIPVYRWARTDDPTPLRRLVGQAVAGTVDAITFTSEPAVTATLAVAAEDDLEELLLEAMRTHVVAACVGPVTAAPLRARGVAPTTPRRARLSGLVRALAVELPARRASRLAVHGHALELRGHAVVLDGQLKPIAPAPMAILRALARRPGHVVSRAELCGVLPGRALPSGPYGRPQADEHAVEMAVARLRRGLGGGGLVETVVKRGYRLACDPGLTADRPLPTGTAGPGGETGRSR